MEYSKNKDALWYKDAIIYEVHIKSFYDSNGDGIGDLEGFLQKLDYLQDLGITAIWLLPFYPSPLRDDGYDIADYYSLNPDFGDIPLFKKLIREAHARDLKVITELVINHTSDQHPWFQRARKAPAGSPDRDYYVWSDHTDKYKDARIIFTDTETSNWSWDEEAQMYYWHRFFSHQPDLNFDNPLVQQEVLDILHFWLEMGVDGFRLDAIPYLFEREGTNCENLPETHQFLKKLRKYVDDHFENKLLLAEANMWPEDSVAYFGNGDQCHMNYHFPIMPRMFMAVKMENRYPITDIIDQTPDIPEDCQWAVFLRNHDELTLEMVTDEERDYMYRVYTKEARAKINVGIRHRLAPLLENNRPLIELMNVLLFSMPGTPVIYYGDEIGMGDNFYLGDRDGVRTPMQWNADRNAGFSTANPHKLYLPVIIDPEYRYENINVENQQRNASSLLWWMKKLIAMRKKYPAFGRGDIEFLNPANAKVLTFTRTYNEETLLVIANLSRFPQAVELDLEKHAGSVPVEVFSRNAFPPIGEKPYLFTLGSHGYFWFAIEPAREEILEDKPLMHLRVQNLEDLIKGRTRRILESEILPRYLQGVRWFGGKGQTIQAVHLLKSLPVRVGLQTFLLNSFRVTYTDHMPEDYILPLGFISEEDEKLQPLPPPAKVADLSLDHITGWLIDAVYSTEFRSFLFRFIRESDTIRYESTELKGDRSENMLSGREDPKNRLMDVDQSNTSIVYDEKYFLKLYRKIDAVINPDLEIIRFLSEEKQFRNVPEYMGAVSLQEPGKPPIVIAMLQQMIENQGEAYGFTKDMISRFLDHAMSQGDLENFRPEEKKLTVPPDTEELADEINELLGPQALSLMALLGQRTAEMHLALASSDHPDFVPEPFSKHYQRSLYSGLRSLTRTAMDNLKKNLDSLPEELHQRAKNLIKNQRDILEAFKKIFSKKINTIKIRNHGDYHLGQVLWTGEDFIIIDFEGEPARPFSERRLKRNPLRDVAGMIRSLHYAVYDTIKNHQPDTMEGDAEKWGIRWYNLMSRVFLDSYRKHMDESEYLPVEEKDFQILLDTFLLEKAIYELNYEINNRPEWTGIPLRGIEALIRDIK